MSQLLQPKLIPSPQENLYELFEDYQIDCLGQKIMVPIYFKYDGASIPPPAWQITYSPFAPDVMLPSLIHDWLFFNHQVDQELTDEIFYTLLKENGVSNLKASMMWGAVKTFGGIFWDNDEKDLEMLIELCKKVQHLPNFSKYKFPTEVTSKCGI